MLRGLVRPIGFILGGILCIHLSAFAAETDTKKPSEPTKKAKAAPKVEAKSEAKAETNEPKQKEAAPSKQTDDSKKILATVNGENISQKDVNQILTRFGNQIPEEQMPAVTKQILDGLINQKLIMQFIRYNKIEPSKTDIDA